MKISSARSIQYKVSSFVLLALLLSPATRAADYPIKILGGDETSFTPATTAQAIVHDSQYDIIVVGAGLAGLSAAIYLSDQGKHVLLIEKESAVGGLAAGGVTPDGVRYDRGAAYWTDAADEELEILKHIGLGDYDEYAIHEPIDSYLWNGKLYEGIWEHKTLEQLPASYAVFKYELEHASEDGLIGEQPFEEFARKDLDAYTAREWIRLMPARLSLRKEPEAVAVYKRYLADPQVNRAAPMDDVIGLLDLYSRSALGAPTELVSAMAFANFYISELVTRYTTQTGTARAAELMEQMLKARPDKVAVLTRAPVGKIVPGKASVSVTYSKDGVQHEAKGSYLVFAGELKIASKLIEGFDQADAERAAVIKGMEYANYAVHAVMVKGHPYRATYDTWTRAADYTADDFTDVILGRWMDPSIKGFEGMRDFLTHPADDQGIMSIYHPLGLAKAGMIFDDSSAIATAERAVNRMIELYSPLLSERWGTKIDVMSVETSRWPYSVHVAAPGHFTHKAKILRRPMGRIFFANNNMGTPAFEEALFRGHCAANNILKRMDSGFANESWSKCPLE